MEKTFAGTSKTVKIMNGFSLERFPLYGKLLTKHLLVTITALGSVWQFQIYAHTYTVLWG